MRFVNKILSAIFVDSAFWHRYWHCHQIPSRSFRVNGRQFHICARCTGLAAGMLLAPLGFLGKAENLGLYLIFPAALIIDGITQAAQFRTSKNSIRFLTGLGTPISLTAVVASLI